MVRILAAIVTSLSLTLSGCATLFTSDSEVINVTSEPPGARFQYGPYTGTTPASIAVPRRALASYCNFRKEGYEEKTVPVVTGIQGVTWIGVLFPLALIIDFVTGAAYELEPPLIQTTLDKKQG